jgi:hypothetical protein
MVNKSTICLTYLLVILQQQNNLFEVARKLKAEHAPHACK